MRYVEEFKYFYYPNFYEQNFHQNNTIIVIDTSSLLNIFRFPHDLSNVFLETIAIQEKWLYILYFVALEFHFHKDNFHDFLVSRF